MSINKDWPSGHRRVHHGLESKRAQRDQALVFRDHHTEDNHTHDDDYAAIDEAFTRLDVLERPSTTKRLDRLRKLAEARVIRRQYNREANWLVANDEHLHYQHRLGLHTRYPDQYPHPGTDDLDLRAEDLARIGPVKADIDVECDARIDDLRPRIDELLILQAASKPHFPGHTDRVQQQVGAHANTILHERERARFLKVLSAVHDDYFEPKYWNTGISDDLRTYTRLAQLGTPSTKDDQWHALATAGLTMASDHDDMLAVCAAAISARDSITSFPVWTNPPSTLPSITVNVNPPARVSVSWSGSLPSGVRVILTLVQSTELRTASPFFIRVTGARNVTFAGERLAVLVQFERQATAEVSMARTRGTFGYVGALTP